MEQTIAVRRLSALAQPNRLSVFRLLVKAGKGGMPAGEISRTLNIAPNTLSAQLNVLSNAGLLRGIKDGRSIIYVVEFETMGELMVYLVEDCCQGHADVCVPIAEVTERIACCD